MKENTHPNYREVAFVDMASNVKFIIRSCVQTREMIDVDGVSYPAFKCEVTADSHPFYTGQQKIVDAAGNVEKFRRRFGKIGSKTAALADAPAAN